MGREKPKTARRRLDAALKAAFDAKAAEPAPQRLIDLVEDLSTPPKATKAG